ncbi:hypothetical protein AB0J57_29710 [Streptomyces sp. NPDC049837]|uniref:hypothetical protein n=1 Tax=Streptomyces sp. NPDC049837 TaxID=3155277 RepID=UPI0034457F39
MDRRLRPSAALAVVCAVAGAACSGGVAQPAVGPPVAPTSPGLETLAESVRKDIAKVWPRTGRIWPGMDFTDHNVLITDGRKTYAVDKDGRRAVSPEELKRNKVDVPQQGGFDVVSWQGKDSVIVRPPEGRAAESLKQDPTGLGSPDVASYTFELATHEQFHPYVQHDKKAPWKSLEEAEKRGGGARDELYPLKAEPRIHRAMIYNSLLTAYEDPGRRTEQLAAAAYWHRAWTEQYPDEAEQWASTDLLEGTAKYVERVAVAMARSDDPDSESQVRAYLVRTLKPMKVAAKGLEPYAIGTAALLNADELGLDVKKTLTTEPVTPLSLLLKNVRPAARQTAPDDVVRGIRNSVAKTNEELAGEIEPFVKGVQDKRKTVLMLPADRVSGSLGGKGFYTTEELPITIVPAARVTFRLASGTITLDQVTTGELIQDDNTAYFAVPLDPEDENVSLKGNRLTLTGDGLTGTATVRSTMDDGQRFLYAQ